jgi:hypothetical protein
LEKQMALSLNRFVTWFFLAVGILATAYVFSASAVPYLIFNEEALAKFDGRRAWIVVHVFTASIPLLAGPFQIWMGIKGKWPAFHRRLGITSMVSIAISASTAFYLAINIDGPLGEAAGLFGAGVLWVFTTSMGYISVRRHQYSKHMDWMIRSYAVTLAFVAFRVFIMIGKAIKVGTFDERLTVAAWSSWIVPLLITELLIMQRKRMNQQPIS